MKAKVKLKSLSEIANVSGVSVVIDKDTNLQSIVDKNGAHITKKMMLYWKNDRTIEISDHDFIDGKKDRFLIGEFSFFRNWVEKIEIIKPPTRKFLIEVEDNPRGHCDICALNGFICKNIFIGCSQGYTIVDAKEVF